MEIVILIWIVCGIAAAVIASNRGADGCLWFGLGILFGPIGLAIAFTAGGDQRKCPYCQSSIHAQAIRCPKCQATLAHASAAAGGLAATPSPRLAGLVAATASPPFCQSCGAEVPPNFGFCGVCGTRVSRATLSCQACKAGIPTGNRFCGSCGTPVPPEPPTAVPVPAKSKDAGPPPAVPSQGQTESLDHTANLDNRLRRTKGKPWRRIAVAILLCAFGIWLAVQLRPDPAGLDGEAVSDPLRRADLYNAAQARIVLDHPAFRYDYFGGPFSSIFREKGTLSTVRLHYREGGQDRVFVCTMRGRDSAPQATPPGTYYASGRWFVTCEER